MLITLPELREVIGADAAKDGVLKRALAATVAAWEFRTNRLWDLRTGYVQTWRPQPGDAILNTKLYPLTTIAFVEWNDDVTIDDAVVTDEVDYTSDLERGSITRVIASDTFLTPGSFLSPDFMRLGRVWGQNVRATMSGGYMSTTLPADVKDVLILQTHFHIIRNQSTNLILTSKSKSAGSGTFIDSPVHPLFASLAQAKKRHVV